MKTLPPQWKNVRAAMRIFAVAGAAIFLILIFYAIAYGFPLKIFQHTLRIKDIKILCSGFTLLGVAAFLLGEGGFQLGYENLKRKLCTLSQHPWSLAILVQLFAVLLTWQQITEFLSLKINFLPFSFYDYMLYYFFQGRINYTGLLHSFYHVNNILYLFSPLWAIVKSPLLLVLIYGPIASLAAIPLYGIARERFGHKGWALLVAFVYLNYHYLQKMMQFNFSIEIFYPLFLFTALYAAMKKQWLFYYAAVISGLFIKEDSFIYFSALGLIVFCLPKPLLKWDKNRLHGLSVILIGIVYYFCVIKFFIPATGSDILKGDLENFQAQGQSHQEIFYNVLQPKSVLNALFGSHAKLSTYRRLLSHILFIPLLSPSVLTVFIPVFPLFLHQTGRDADFIDLRFHYSAAVIPFVFIAFTFGFSNLYRKLQGKWKEFIMAALGLSLILVNGGQYRSEHFTKEDLQSIQWARSIPQNANLVTHGHLLPYTGYRRYNYYFAEPYELLDHEAHEPFSHADYYLIDLHVNPYPMDRNYLDKKIKDLQNNPDYELMRSDDTRYLFKLKGQDS